MELDNDNKRLDEEPWRLAAECTTSPTDTSGERDDCDSDVSEVNCPDGWVLDDKVYKEHLEKNGTNNRVYLNFHNYVRPFPDVPQIEYPTRVTLSVHARSPGGHSSGRGWTKAVYEGRMFKTQQLVDHVRASLKKIDG